ncbi:UNKNOWN [Stylonychia lemnae]|uniref:Uncharacterized protein n=1 Tax=Stylonychia lemnae TaxID=5949 RepID=A0A078APB6_STYLE|nr:UNKNOWN [Stylonychia lemnae]|eukprot:CDW83162.1 UNKNOWN [Stylonychia lemnae]
MTLKFSKDIEMEEDKQENLTKKTPSTNLNKSSQVSRLIDPKGQGKNKPLLFNKIQFKKAQLELENLNRYDRKALIIKTNPNNKLQQQTTTTTTSNSNSNHNHFQAINNLIDMLKTTVRSEKYQQNK